MPCSPRHIKGHGHGHCWLGCSSDTPVPSAGMSDVVIVSRFRHLLTSLDDKSARLTQLTHHVRTSLAVKSCHVRRWQAVSFGSRQCALIYDR